MHNRFVHVVAGLSAGVLFLFATVTAVANPVVVDASFTGAAQTVTFSQSIAPNSLLELNVEGVFLGNPYVSTPANQTDPVTHQGGTTFTSATPVGLTDNRNPTGSTDGPTPQTTQMTFGAFDWQLQNIDNLNVDLLNGTDILGEWNQINHEILISGALPGAIKIDLFHRTFEWSYHQAGAPTIGTDGSFSIPTNLYVGFNATSEGLRPTGSESVHGSGVDLLTVDGAPAFIDQDGVPGPDIFTLTGSVTTTTQGDAFGAGLTPGTRDVLIELDGSFDETFLFDAFTTFASQFGPTLGATGSLNLANTFAVAATYHLQQLLSDVHRLKGDISGDGAVDIGDFTLWADSFGATGDGSQVEDISMDGSVDIGDFTLWADQFQATGNSPGGSGGASAVPEPSSVVLLCIGLVGLVSYGWRRRRRLG